jgi:hypothetical protein
MRPAILRENSPHATERANTNEGERPHESHSGSQGFAAHRRTPVPLIDKQ